jgi:WD40 repeat protein
MVCKYTIGGYDVVASVPSADLVVVATGEQAVVLDQSSGEVQHRLNTPSYSVTLSPDYDRVYSGGYGGVTVWDVGTGSLVAASDVQLNDTLVWIEHIGSFIAAGTGHSRKAICWDDYNTDGEIVLFPVTHRETLDVANKWDVGAPCFHHCYLSCREFIFSACKGEVRGFNLHGERVIQFTELGQCVYTVAAHPTEPTILSGSNDHVIREWNVDSKTMVRSITDTTSSGWYFGGNWSVSYDPTGYYVLSTEPQSQSVRLYSFADVLVDELKGHADCINRIKVVPGLYFMALLTRILPSKSILKSFKTS